MSIWEREAIHDALADAEGVVEHLPLSEDRHAAFIRSGLQTGGAFILDSPATPRAIWGRGDDVLMADGESLIVAGRQGLGKSTLGQQLALGRCGLPEYADLLGYPVAAGERRVLYLAMDRPRQIARSMARMVGGAMRAELDDRLVVWQGPPPWDLAKQTGLLLEMCREADADTVVVDSLKDAAVGLTEDEVAAGYNRARQKAIAAGVQVIDLHHTRKTQQGGAERPSVDALYGSTWLTSGAGSVLLLTGDPGDPVVGLHHIKQPANEVGPFKVLHDHSTGRTTIWEAADLAAAAAAHPLTAVDAARLLFDAESPTGAQKEKARRRLNALTREGRLRVLEEGDQATNTPRLWGSA